MFDYDRLSLDVKEQFAKSTTPPANAKDTKDTLSNGSSESQLFGWESPSPPAAQEDEENAIVHGLSELLRRCSSPGHHFAGQYQQQQQFGQPRNSPGNGGHFQRHRSATISNGAGANEQQMLYSQTMISPNLHHQYQQQQFGAVQQPQQQRHHRTIGNALSMDLSDQQQPNRRFSGGSMNFSEIFDCGASSGYGSPGAVGTPLASPAAAATAQYIAHQLQKMFDQGYCEPNGGAGTGMSPPMPMMGAMGGATPIKTNGNCKGIAASVPPQSGLSTPAATPMAIPPGATPVLVKATTTTTGTNKNSNKRKTSIANVVANGNGGGGAGVVQGGQQANGMMGMAATAQENIVATEDGFDKSEIAEFAELLTSPKRQPPSRYLCHICYQPGHYISDCPQRFNSPYEELTPYQGRKKCYGEFQCEQCKRKWTSQNSVANEAQSCIKCHVPVFPHKQLPVDKAIALGLVKLQRLPVPGSPTTPPTPVPGAMLSGGGGPLASAAASQKSQPPILTAAQSQAVRNMVEDAANIYLGLKNGSLTTNSAANAAAMTQLAI